MKSRKALIISYYFPPYGGGGVYRILKFIKYLPDFGWQPAVITSEPRKYYWAFDHSLLEDVPAEVNICRTSALDPFYLFALLDKLGLNRFKEGVSAALCVPDEQAGWIPFALAAALRVLKQWDADVIFTSSPPHSTHVIGYLLKKLTGKPWVADFRDAWTLQALYRRPPWRKRIETILEGTVLDACDCVIANTPGSRESHLQHFKAPEERFAVIPNGFDAQDFEAVRPSIKEGADFLITYAGAFYREYSPESLLRAIRMFLTTRPELKSRVRVVFAGSSGGFASLIEKFGLGEVVQVQPHLAHREAVRLMLSSQVLLLALPNGSRSGDWVPGKLYEYMASGRPILGLLPKGNAQAMIEKSRTGFIVGPDNPELASTILYRLFCDYREGKPSIEPDWDVVNEFERKKLTRALSEVFDRVV